MKNTVSLDDIYPDFLTALIDDIEAALNAAGCVGVGEFDEDQWLNLPGQIGVISARLIQMQDDCPDLAPQLAKSQSIQIVATHAFSAGKPYLVNAVFYREHCRQWEGVRLLLDDLLKDVKRMREGF